eukprot:CAMPEP_0170166748 /NCGR_PEP_ID=MMETSP0040_2-20121228/352_1 /TAXON_ID=641309 /ORGANISM="Lotharella oceanica, Strain CCMP622" /LENGTH=107 /DNA_ID=CAMNT_0010404555 /DNA_START=223 /DNA_END=543 /DNA_ORIENTATION=-
MQNREARWRTKATVSNGARCSHGHAEPSRRAPHPSESPVCLQGAQWPPNPQSYTGLLRCTSLSPVSTHGTSVKPHSRPTRTAEASSAKEEAVTALSQDKETTGCIRL